MKERPRKSTVTMAAAELSLSLGAGALADRRGSSEARPQGRVTLSEIGFHHVDHLIGRVCLLRVWFPLWVKHMVPDVAFQEFRHQAVDCTSCRADDLQHLRTITPLIEDPLKSLKLPPDAFAPQNQFLFVLNCMTHSQADDNMPELAIYLWGYVSYIFLARVHHVAAHGPRCDRCASGSQWRHHRPFCSGHAR